MRQWLARETTRCRGHMISFWPLLTDTLDYSGSGFHLQETSVEDSSISRSMGMHGMGTNNGTQRLINLEEYSSSDYNLLAALKAVGNCTISLWFRMDPSGDGPVFSQAIGYPWDSPDGFFFYFMSGYFYLAAGYWYDAYVSRAYDASHLLMGDGSTHWVHVVAVVANPILFPSDVWRLYANGEEIIVDYSESYTVTDLPNTARTWIGAAPIDEVNIDVFKGHIALVRIYPNALSGAEINRLYRRERQLVEHLSSPTSVTPGLSGFCDLTVYNQDLVADDVDLSVTGHDSATGVLELSVAQYGPIINDLDMYVAGSVKITDDVDFYMAGHGSAVDVLELSVAQHGPAVTNLDLSLTGHATIIESLDTYLCWAATAGLMGFVEGHIRHETANLDLSVVGGNGEGMVGVVGLSITGSAMNEGLNLVVCSPEMGVLEQGMPLSVSARYPSTAHSVLLSLPNVEWEGPVETTRGLDCVMTGWGVTNLDTWMHLYISRPESGVLPLLLQGPPLEMTTGTELVVTGCQTVVGGVELVVPDPVEGIEDNVVLYSHGF